MLFETTAQFERAAEQEVSRDERRRNTVPRKRARFAASENATASESKAPAQSGPIVFAAPYTDTFYLVFTNPYPASSGLKVTVYAATQYEPNVVIS